MKSGRLFAVVLITVGLAGCSPGDTPSGPSTSTLTRGSSSPAPSSASSSPTTTSSSSETSSASAALDGVYRLDFNLTKQFRNGAPDAGKPFELWFAFRSSCDRDNKCIAIGRQLRDDDHEKPAEQPQTILDFVNGEWVGTTSGQSACGGGKSPVLQAWSLKPVDERTLSGTRSLAFFSPSSECTAAYEQPMLATRTGDVDEDLTITDPAKEAPLRRVPAEGFTGRYDKSLTADNGQKGPVVSIDVSTTCIRNVPHCLTLTAYVPPGGGARTVRAYEFQKGAWAGVVKSLAKCPSGAAVTETTHSEWGLPNPVSDPIQQLTGTQQEVYPDPCKATVQSTIVMVRTGD